MAYHLVITGDIIHSRKYESGEWLPQLEKALKQYTTDFDVFRGDSFQAELPLDKLFSCVFYLKSVIRQKEGMDVRMGIGIGAISYRDSNIKKASGEAFINSGKALDSLSKESLAFISPWLDLDEQMNLILTLSTRLVDQWTVNMAEAVQMVMDYPDKNQTEITQLLKRTHQSQVSRELNKANYNKLDQVIQYCTKQLAIYVNKPA
ncbi:hypothetical protein GQF61_13455 [Sphingobacterium sp. DK4209]|uniref:Uncharacterized protein n=1 Tax=Sphingobacterium zhuxiongii TaxID=2662364 RepID=A0A5Q0Q8B6_9SPHI|nr:MULTISPECIES: hypothetical protein [unclassified Sphingobacterium]MVZ66863.1 hypothetical protein [Sphingobacterium sp. DK4209]QGA26215.1 hypothetical protein GFH32_07700 [Sphingobacterium sp. dk4302]